MALSSSQHTIYSTRNSLFSEKGIQNVRTVCKFHQYGSCKFGDTCRQFHTLHTCNNFHCDRSSCLSRHPKSCVYHQNFEYCKFESKCFFLHFESKTEILGREIKTLKEGFQAILESLSNKEDEIKLLSEKIKELDKFKSSLNKQLNNSLVLIVANASKQTEL